MTSLSPIGIVASSVETAVPVGQADFTTPGTFSWTPPAGVTSVCVICVGGGGGGGGSAGGNIGPQGGSGGGLSWRNNITVIPGAVNVDLIVGDGGAGGSSGNTGASGGGSFFRIGGSSYVRANGGTGGQRTSSGRQSGGTGGTNTSPTVGSNGGGGNGGYGGYGDYNSAGGAGGGAGGYSFIFSVVRSRIPSPTHITGIIIY